MPNRQFRTPPAVVNAQGEKFTCVARAIRRQVETQCLTDDIRKLVPAFKTGMRQARIILASDGDPVEAERIFMISVRRYDDAIMVDVRCELDIAARADFEACLDEARVEATGNVVVSLLHCRYLDSTALGVLAKATRQMERPPVLVVAPDSQVMRVLTIVKFDEVFSIYATVDEALRPEAVVEDRSSQQRH